MKLSSLFCAAVVGLASLAPVTARADHDSCERTRVTYDHCGNPVYWTYTFVGRDHCGRPVYQWVQTSRGGYGGGGGYRSDYGYDRSGYDRGGYSRGGYGGDSCDHGHSGVSFYWSH